MPPKQKRDSACVTRRTVVHTPYAAMPNAAKAPTTDARAGPTDRQTLSSLSYQNIRNNLEQPQTGSLCEAWSDPLGALGLGTVGLDAVQKFEMLQVGRAADP